MTDIIEKEKINEILEKTEEEQFEIAKRTVLEGGTILKVNAETGKNIDLRNRGIIGGDDYTMTHAIARGARKHGYDSITFVSSKNPSGINTVIFNPNNVSVEEILR